MIRVGWITSANFPHWRWKWFWRLGSSTYMRCANIALWMNRNTNDIRNEMYNPNHCYDIVIFVKAMNQECQSEARRIQGYGGKVIFDANVNYYEVWGEYDIPVTRPTCQQQHDAIAMTKLADWVVADSSYIKEIAERFNPNVTWIPDNVNPSIYKGQRVHTDAKPVRLIWSGISKKAQHLTLISSVLARLSGVELWLVSEKRPHIIKDLPKNIKYRYIRFSDRRYAKSLLQCDIIISPKRLINAYEMGHTEYKISLGMALGLPAVASPQQSYVEIINKGSGGIIAEGESDWYEALNLLINDVEFRRDMGVRARKTVLEHYITPVVATQYAEIIRQLCR